MREIKFRAWDGVKMWYPDSKTVDGNGVSFHFYNNGIGWGLYDNNLGNRLITGDPNAIFNTPGNLMQLTNLKDKNGKEIWEGDRVKRRVHLVEGSDYMDYNCEVKWNGWCYALFVADKQLWGLDPITAKECEVTGNIYELLTT